MIVFKNQYGSDAIETPPSGITFMKVVSLTLFLSLSLPLKAVSQQEFSGITDVPGIKLGHHQLKERPTGCTVLLTENGAVGGVDIGGGAPGTVETDLLDPTNTVQEVHAIVISGSSAFGLSARDGVMKYLKESGVGYPVGNNLIPIVPGATLYDLGIEGYPDIHITADCGYQAALNATSSYSEEGNIGAGAGATVGKLKGMAYAMKGGIGTASITLDNGLIVAALVAVNSVGDIIDPSVGQIIAGVLTDDKKGFADARKLIRSTNVFDEPSFMGNTTIAIIATNAKLSKSQATKVAQMAQDGIAGAIYPAHTTRDGDTVFSLSTGTYHEPSDVSKIGSLAPDMLVESILRALKAAKGLQGIPSIADLTPGF